MGQWFKKSHIDWPLFLATLPVMAAGLVTMSSFAGEANFFGRQLLWIGIALVIFFLASSFDMRFLNRSSTLVALYVFGIVTLIAVFAFGVTRNGATSWIDFGGFSFQPADLMKLFLILILAKYFSRRHVEIRHPRHIIISGLYLFIPFLLIFLQPDFGSALVLVLIWFGMILVSGISKRQLFVMLAAAVALGAVVWSFALQPYQQDRIKSFLDPLADIQGTGYNAYQSMIAVGSGQLIGKGVGYGTQSRLQFLPEYQTDFIFAAFAEEWGFVGSLLIFILYGVIIWRILKIAGEGVSNFETLYAVGVAAMLMGHFIINVGMNINMMPVTGITLPFLSYGGSHLVTTFLALGMLMAMRKYRRTLRRGQVKQSAIDFLG